MTRARINSEWIEYKIEQSSNVCFFHFSARNTSSGKFNKWPTPAGSSNVYINSLEKDWYVRGMPCWGSTLAESFHQFSKLLKELGDQKIVCIGSSMGAYGAALFACKFELDLICFGPELYLNIYSGFSKSDNLIDKPRLDELGSNPARALIFAGLNSPSDVICAAYFSDRWPFCKSIYLRGCGHATGKFLKDRSLLAGVIDRFSRGLDVDDYVSYISHNSAKLSKILLPPQLFSKESLDQYLEIAMVEFKLSDLIEICGHLLRRGAYASSIHVLDKVLEMHGPVSEVMLLRAQCLRRLRRDKEALSVFSALKSNQFFGSNAAMGCAMIANRPGDFKAERDEYAALVMRAKRSLAQYSLLLDKSGIILSGNQTSQDTFANSSFRIDQKLNDPILLPFDNSISELSLPQKINELIDSGRVNNARQELEAALTLHPKSMDLHKQYIAISHSESDWIAVIKKMESLLPNEDGQVSSWIFATLIQASRNCKKFELADFYAEEGLNRFPEDPYILSECAWNAQSQKKWPLAISLLERLIVTNYGMRDKTYQRLARAYRECNHASEARDIINEGLSRFPASQRLIQERDHLVEWQNTAYKIRKVNEQDGELQARVVVLTTFPEHKSMNVGDNLICSSTISLIKSRTPSFDPLILFREERMDHYADSSVTMIIAPGFSVSDRVYPSLYRLYSKLERMPYFVPVGCAFQHQIPAMRSFSNYQYAHETVDFLKFVAEYSGPLPCRDQLIVDLLLRYDVPAVYSGDMAIYDARLIGSEFVPPQKINSVVFTIQHYDSYFEQSLKLLELLQKHFSDARLYVAFHSKVGLRSRQVADHAMMLGFTELHLYGDVENLSVYDDIDLHVGYRLHGHISFLRRRKPSVLLIEDARSFGFAHTEGTSVGCFSAMLPDLSDPDMGTPNRVIDFVINQVSCGFQDYKSVFEFIDKTFSSFVSPFFDKLSTRISK